MLNANMLKKIQNAKNEKRNDSAFDFSHSSTGVIGEETAKPDINPGESILMKIKKIGSGKKKEN